MFKSLMVTAIVTSLTYFAYTVYAIEQLRDEVEEVAVRQELSKPTFDYTKFNQMHPYDQRQITCLADNIYFESRNQEKTGQVAVAFVTLNRVYHSQFKNSVCGVVKESSKTNCQFSWYCDGLSDAIHEKKVYKEILKLSTFVYNNYQHLDDVTYGSLFYHATYVNPNWKFAKKKIKIGNHIFYQLKDEYNHDAKTQFTTKGKQSVARLLLTDGGHKSSVK